MPQRNKWIRNALIVLIAAGVVIPVGTYAMRHMHEVSEQRTCAGNLKRLGEACAMYQTDWHDVLVPYGAPFAWVPPGMWTSLIEPYLKKIVPPEPGKIGKLFRCPSYDEEEAICFCVHQTYGMNERCGGWQPGEKPIVVPLRKVRYPHATIRIAEVLWWAQGGSFFAAKPSEFKPGDPKCHLFATWHMGKGNVLWIDGHVSSMTLEQYNMRDKGPYDGNIWLRLEGPKPPVP